MGITGKNQKKTYSQTDAMSIVHGVKAILLSRSVQRLPCNSARSELDRLILCILPAQALHDHDERHEDSVEHALGFGLQCEEVARSPVACIGPGGAGRGLEPCDRRRGAEVVIEL